MFKLVNEIEEAKALRLQGKSINVIAQELNVSKSSVSIWVRKIPQPEKFTKEYKSQKKKERQAALTIERSKNRRVKKSRILSGSGYWMVPIPDNYEGKKYPCGYIYEHRYVLENKIGRSLKRTEIAHHINGDPRDNRPENLEIKGEAEHNRHHRKDRPIKFVKLKCPNCSKIFIKYKHKTFLTKGGACTFCSAKCKGAFLRKVQLNRIDFNEKNKRISENVIKEFTASIAQLEEYNNTNVEAPGSSPGGGTISQGVFPTVG